METPGRWHTDVLTHPLLWRQRSAEALGIPGPGPTPRGPIPILTPECGSFAARRLQDGIREATLGDGPWRSP
jgi:hypothetical protein